MHPASLFFTQTSLYIQCTYTRFPFNVVDTSYISNRFYIGGHVYNYRNVHTCLALWHKSSVVTGKLSKHTLVNSMVMLSQVDAMCVCTSSACTTMCICVTSSPTMLRALHFAAGNQIALTVYHDPKWLIQDTTFEKMGVLTAENNRLLLALYDELSQQAAIFPRKTLTAGSHFPKEKSWTTIQTRNPV